MKQQEKYLKFVVRTTDGKQYLMNTSPFRMTEPQFKRVAFHRVNAEYGKFYRAEHVTSVCGLTNDTPVQLSMKDVEPLLFKDYLTERTINKVEHQLYSCIGGFYLFNLTTHHHCYAKGNITETEMMNLCRVQVPV